MLGRFMRLGGGWVLASIIAWPGLLGCFRSHCGCISHFLASVLAPAGPAGPAGPAWWIWMGRVQVTAWLAAYCLCTVATIFSHRRRDSRPVDLAWELLAIAKKKYTSTVDDPDSSVFAVCLEAHVLPQRTTCTIAMHILLEKGPAQAGLVLCLFCP